MAKRRLIRVLEVRVANLIVQLSTHSYPPSTICWDETATQRVYTAARQQLARLKAAINDGDDFDEDAAHYWKRRCHLLDRELVSSAVARRRRDQWQAGQELLALSSPPSPPPPSSAVEEAKAITESLERTHEMMRSSLKLVESAVDTICSDGRVIDDTFDQHRSIKSATTQASRLLRRMQHQQREDKWKLRAALALFGLVCCFVVVRRLPGVVLLWTANRFDGNNKATHFYNRLTIHRNEQTSAKDEVDSEVGSGWSSGDGEGSAEVNAEQIDEAEATSEQSARSISEMTIGVTGGGLESEVLDWSMQEPSKTSDDSPDTIQSIGQWQREQRQL